MGSIPRGISGSRAAAILGLGEYEGQTAFTVWQQIEEERRPGFNAERGYLLPEPPDNAAIRFGTAFEDAIVELAEARQGKKITRREAFYSIGFDGNPDEQDGAITCHIDGAYEKDGSAWGGALHEGKTTNLFSFRELWGEPGTERVPQGYQVQGQHQMLCTGAELDIFSVLVFPRRPEEWEAEGWVSRRIQNEGWIFVLNPTPTEDGEINQHWFDPRDWARVIAEMGLFYQYPVHAVSSLQAEMVERYRHFWHTYVLPEREPPINCYPDMQRAFPAPVGTIVVTEQEGAWLSERKMITEEIGDTSPMARRKRELATLTLESIRARIGCAVIDTESQDKVIFRDGQGKKLGQYDGKTFR